MPPTVHLIRHAESVHNVNPSGSTIDPELTSQGRGQCEKLKSDFSRLGDKLVCVLASPMQRTIETALLTFRHYSKTRQIVLLPDLRECGWMPSDTGSSREVLEGKFGSANLDFSLVHPGWNDLNLHGRFGPCRVTRRAQAVRLYIRAIAQAWRDSDVHFAVVSHSRFIDALILESQSWFRNAESRAYEFDLLVGSELNAELVESRQSVMLRRFTGNVAPLLFGSQSMTTGQMSTLSSGITTSGPSPDSIFAAQPITPAGTRSLINPLGLATTVTGPQGCSGRPACQCDQ
ncbi:histidine phosphatase superfamily [Xylaria nigripes]|nr:histidine phosphatase superfamily [Xylaria nigripes]